jgi:competence ComEA-like helix-hairpin-helix protein
VPLYSRAQVKLLLTLAATLLAGLAVGEWRAGFPELSERLERFDREATTAPAPLGPGSESADARPRKVVPPPVPATVPGGAPALAQPSATAVDGQAPLDLNRATAAELARLPGIGPTLAERITAERERRGRFDSPDALRAVLGVGPKKLAAIRDLVKVEP